MAVCQDIINSCHVDNVYITGNNIAIKGYKWLLRTQDKVTSCCMLQRMSWQAIAPSALVDAITFYQLFMSQLRSSNNLLLYGFVRKIPLSPNSPPARFTKKKEAIHQTVAFN